MLLSLPLPTVCRCSAAAAGFVLPTAAPGRDAEVDLVPVCRELGIGIVAYSPLGRGMLTGAFNKLEDIPEGEGGADLALKCGLSDGPGFVLKSPEACKLMVCPDAQPGEGGFLPIQVLSMLQITCASHKHTKLTIRRAAHGVWVCHNVCELGVCFCVCR